MFIDELFEKYLIEDGMTYGDAILKVCQEKLSDDDGKNLVSVKQIDNGFRLYCKRHPGTDTELVRKYVHLRSPKLYRALGWDESNKK